MRLRLISTWPNLLLPLVNMYPLRNKSPSVKSVPGSCCPLPWPCSSSGTPPVLPGSPAPRQLPPWPVCPGHQQQGPRSSQPRAAPEWTPPRAPRSSPRAEGSPDRTRGLTPAHACLSSDTAAGAGSVGKGQGGRAGDLRTAHDPSESRVFPPV